MLILYGVCGEGRGHAGRSFALADSLLKCGHKVEVFTFDQGFDLFAISGFPLKSLHHIPPLRFSETCKGISASGTVGNYISSWLPRHKAVSDITKRYYARKPDLVISDFEPLLAKVARSLHVPLLTVDNQHKFLSPLREGFGWTANMYSFLLGLFVRWFIGPADHHIITTFHRCRFLKDITKVDVLLRDEFVKLRPTMGEHVLVYLHSSLAQFVIPLLRQIEKERFLVYGTGGESSDNIEFRSTSYLQFVHDVASCKCIICTAGNQLLGEAKYLGKKLLAIPIPRQQEQIINAHYIELERIGMECPLNKLSVACINDFLQTDFPTQKSNNGLDKVLELIERKYGRCDYS